MSASFLTMTDFTCKMTARLSAIAAFVRQDAVLADVGTDHAYLPIALVLQKRVKRCICTDIHAGPVASARAHIESVGLADSITVLCADGLTGVAPYAPTDIVIAGMGGELIAQILSCADFVLDPDLRFYLQPMSRADKLRSYLWEHGFTIAEEHYVKEQDHIYQILSVAYTGKSTTYTETDLFLGMSVLPQYKDLYLAYMDRLCDRLTKQREGLSRACQNELTAQQLQKIECLLAGIRERRKHCL